MGLLLSGLGCALFGGIRSLRSVPARMYLAVGFVLVAVAGPYVYRVHLRPIHADMAVKSANRFSKTSRWREAGILYPAALSVESKRHQYYFDFANSLHENARTSTNSVERTRWSLHAIHQLTRAAELAPLNPDYPANLGRHYTWMGTVAADPEMKRVFAEEADDHFQDALRMSPRMPRYWCDRAELYRAVLDQPGTAEALILHALELDSEYWMTHKMLGSVYATVAVNQQDGEAQREFLSKAVEQYETALRLAEPIRKLPLRRDIHRAAGKIYEILGVKTKADEHFALGEKAKRKRKSKR
jgi:tetratricopeptide (TPR) repeat protein